MGCHKFQGQTVSKPTKLITDLQSVFAPAQAYVILSRVQELNQLYIWDKLPTRTKKLGAGPEMSTVIAMGPDPKALTELERLNKIALNDNLPPMYLEDNSAIKISCINARSLKKHFPDLENDYSLLLSQVICVCETWLEDNDIPPQLPGYKSHSNNAGPGKGIAMYYKEDFKFVLDITTNSYQITKISGELDIICVYRSVNGDKVDIANHLTQIIDPTKTTIVTGDFNICYHDNKHNVISRTLENLGFSQLVTKSTHLKGGHLDHIYVCQRKPFIGSLTSDTLSPYWSDHEAVTLTLNKEQEIVEEDTNNNS